MRVAPSVIVGAPGSTVDVPLTLSSPDHVSIVRFTLEYNSAGASFQDVRIGSDAQAAGFTIAAVNPNPVFPAKSPGTNDNLLVIVWSSSSGWLTGTNKQLVVLRFTLATGLCSRSPLNFDPDCNHTDGSTYEGSPLCGPNFELRGGVVANGCVSDAAASRQPAVVLHQNVPNPFNPITRIDFDVATPGPASLRIFAADGSPVRVLLEAVVAAGHREVIWDGRDSSGNRVPSGIYYYRLLAGDADATRSMILLK